MPVPSTEPLKDDVKKLALEAIDNHGKTNVRTVSNGTLSAMRMYIAGGGDLFRQHQAATMALKLDELNPLFTKTLSYDELVRWCSELKILQVYSAQNDPSMPKAGQKR